MKYAIIAMFVCALMITGCQSKQQASQDINLLKQEAITSIVNVPNANGSMTPVEIKRYGNQWVGPKGEVYSQYPTVEQLKELYSIK